MLTVQQTEDIQHIIKESKSNEDLLSNLKLYFLRNNINNGYDAAMNAYSIYKDIINGKWE